MGIRCRFHIVVIILSCHNVNIQQYKETQCDCIQIKIINVSKYQCLVIPFYIMI